jgi:hypothetical protein
MLPMGVEVLSRIRQALSQHVSGSSLAGDGMLVRIRSTSIALLSLVTAIALGLVVFIAQQGWPEVFSGAIPAAPRAAVVHNDTIAQTPAGSSGGVVGPTRGAALRSATSSPRRASSVEGGSSLAGSRKVSGESPAAHTAPVASQPSPTPPPSPAPVEATPSPSAPAPEPATSPTPKASTGGGGNTTASSPLGEVAGGGSSKDDDQKGYGGGRSHGSSPTSLSGLAEEGSVGPSHSRSHHAPEPKEAPPAPTAAPEYQAPPPTQPSAVPSEGRGSEGKGAGSSKGNEKPGRERH